MRRTALLLALLAVVITLSCSEQVSEVKGSNPLLSEFETPFEVPPFDKIKAEHYMPAFEEAMEIHQKQVLDIAGSSEEPTFENTLVALDQSGSLLARTSNIFFGLNSAKTDEQMQDIARKIAPMLSEHRDNIMLNEKLFERIKSVYKDKDELGLDREQAKLLE